VKNHTGLGRRSTKQKAPTLSDIVKEFDAYWEGRKKKKKGSGYKPFKRCANHWEKKKQKDGTIAPPAVLWEAWERKQESEAQQAAIGVNIHFLYFQLYQKNTTYV